MKKPLVFLLAAVTADGFIAKTRGHFADWTSKEDKKFFVELTKDAGVMVMGSTTFATFPRPLKGRKHYVYTTKQTESDDENVVFTNEEPGSLIQRLGREGYEKIAIIGGQHIYGLFLESDVVDEVYLTVEPVLFGAGITLTKNPIDVSMKLLEHKKLNENTVMLHYQVAK